MLNSLGISIGLSLTGVVTNRAYPGTSSLTPCRQNVNVESGFCFPPRDDARQSQLRAGPIGVVVNEQDSASHGQSGVVDHLD
jgi:hypothetical protein